MCTHEEPDTHYPCLSCLVCIRMCVTYTYCVCAYTYARLVFWVYGRYSTHAWLLRYKTSGLDLYSMHPGSSTNMCCFPRYIHIWYVWMLNFSAQYLGFGSLFHAPQLGVDLCHLFGCMVCTHAWLLGTRLGVWIFVQNLTLQQAR